MCMQAPKKMSAGTSSAGMLCICARIGGRNVPEATPRSAFLQLSVKAAFGGEKIGERLRFGPRQA